MGLSYGKYQCYQLPNHSHRSSNTWHSPKAVPTPSRTLQKALGSDLHTNYQDCKSMEASPRNEQEVKDLNIQLPNRTTMGSGVHTPTDPNSFVNIQDIFMALDMWL